MNRSVLSTKKISQASWCPFSKGTKKISFTFNDGTKKEMLKRSVVRAVRARMVSDHNLQFIYVLFNPIPL
jgi:hypothetical protein